MTSAELPADAPRSAAGDSADARSTVEVAETSGAADGAVIVDIGCVSDVGLVRERNEDVLLSIELAGGAPIDTSGPVPLGERGLLLAVFDGMGGAASGDLAARTAAQVVAADLPAAAATDVQAMGEALWRVAFAANDEILRIARRDPRRLGMGTTITASVILGHHLVLVHVGDSRAYLMRGGALEQLTMDQSLQRELAGHSGASVEEVEIASEYSNIILQALGVGTDVEPFVASVEVRRGDRLLLCSDGLTDAVAAEDLLRILEQREASTGSQATELVELAKARGGYDNATVIVAHLSGAGLAEADDCPVEVVPLPPSRFWNQWRRRRLVRAVASVGGAVLLALAIAALIVALGGLG